MAHLIESDPVEKVVKRPFTFIPKHISGKFGLSLCIGKKDIFLGFLISDIEVEKIIRRKVLRNQKAKTKIFTFAS